MMFGCFAISTGRLFTVNLFSCSNIASYRVESQMPNSLSYFALPLAAMLSLGDVRDTAFQSNPIPFPDAGLLVDRRAARHKDRHKP